MIQKIRIDLFLWNFRVHLFIRIHNLKTDEENVVYKNKQMIWDFKTSLALQKSRLQDSFVSKKYCIG